ncbi:hypothetical protein ACQPU1_13390 [Clostridium paraputrificum]|uniref:hypothetical protein n=1 Tax=Clostridium TaxID=1485 RepID=UPI003D333A1E
MRLLQNGTEVYGVSENIIIKSKCFKEFDFQVNTLIKGEKLENILSINVVVLVGEIGIIKTPIKISSEGMYLSGYKLKVELIIDMKMKFMTNSCRNNIGVKSNKIVKVIYIVVPLEHSGESMVDILRKKRVDINTYIEDIYCEVRNYNVIYTNIAAIVTANFN